YTISAEDDWTKTFEGFPAFNDQGVAYVYCVKEPDIYGYELTNSEEDRCTTIDVNQTDDVTLVNEQLEGSIEVIKVDENAHDMFLEGASFELQDSDGETIATGVTN